MVPYIMRHFRSFGPNRSNHKRENTIIPWNVPLFTFEIFKETTQIIFVLPKSTTVPELSVISGNTWKAGKIKLPPSVLITKSVNDGTLLWQELRYLIS